MTAPSSLGQLLEAQTNNVRQEGTPYFFLKLVPAGGINNRLNSQWLQSGSGATDTGVEPGTTPVIPDRTTLGALEQPNATGGRSLYMTSIWVHLHGNGGFALLYDRLAHNGGLAGNTSALQSFSMVPDRHTDGVGNIIFVEIYAQVGATPQTATVIYTDAVNGGGRTSQAIEFGGSGEREGGRMLTVVPQSGDRNPVSVQSVQLSGSTALTGSYGITMAHVYGWVMASAGGSGYKDFLHDPNGFPLIEEDACIATALHGSHQGGFFMCSPRMVEY